MGYGAEDIYTPLGTLAVERIENLRWTFITTSIYATRLSQLICAGLREGERTRGCAQRMSHRLPSINLERRVQTRVDSSLFPGVWSVETTPFGGRHITCMSKPAQNRSVSNGVMGEGRWAPSPPTC